MHDDRVTIRPFEPPDETVVVSLWHRCGLVRPGNDPVRDIARKRAAQPDLLLVAVDGGGSVVGTVMAGYEGRRGWINVLAVDPTRQRRGVGRALVAAAERALAALGCPKVNLQVRADNAAVIAFYRSLGYAVDDVISMGKRLDG